jgi:hypothetical protein
MATLKKKRASTKSATSVRAPAQKKASAKNLSNSTTIFTKFKELAENDAVRYIATGIASAIATRVMANFSTRYPEITSFISENLDGVEGKLMDYKRSLEGGPSTTSANADVLDAAH